MRTQWARCRKLKPGRLLSCRIWRALALTASFAGVLSLLLLWAVRAPGDATNLLLFPDATGTLGVYTTAGSFDTSNPFFQVLGTNGRTCDTCHTASDAYTINPVHIQQRFQATNGTDPLFRPNDGSNCSNSPGVNNSPPSRSAYSLLLSKALIRFSFPIPSNAQFKVKVVSDPYGCALTTDSNGQASLTVYRRVPPATNLRFLSAVMLDGRETIKPLNDPATYQANLQFDLQHQAMDATLGHGQAATSPTQDQLAEIVDFELGTFVAQEVDNAAGSLSAQQGNGGSAYLSTVPYYPGINDSLGSNPTGAAFDPNAFTLFSGWENLTGNNPYILARESVARGEKIFNSAPMMIQDVKGLNDALGVTTIVGTCSTCHDAINSGGHSLPVPLDIGIADLPAKKTDPLAAALAQLNSPLTPVFALTCSTKMGAASNITVQTTDPGRAMITGLCADIGKFKGPVLHGLAGHPPYFQNGAADTLNQVVNFYNERFDMGLTANEKADLVNFLQSL